MATLGRVFTVSSVKQFRLVLKSLQDVQLNEREEFRPLNLC